MAAHVIFCLAYVAVAVSARLNGLGLHLEEAALDLVASPVQAFIQVSLPELLPGIISGCLLAFVLSEDISYDNPDEREVGILLLLYEFG